MPSSPGVLRQLPQRAGAGALAAGEEWVLMGFSQRTPEWPSLPPTSASSAISGLYGGITAEPAMLCPV